MHSKSVPCPPRRIKPFVGDLLCHSVAPYSSGVIEGHQSVAQVFWRAIWPIVSGMVLGQTAGVKQMLKACCAIR